MFCVCLSVRGCCIHPPKIRDKRLISTATYCTHIHKLARKTNRIGTHVYDSLCCCCWAAVRPTKHDEWSFAHQIRPAYLHHTRPATRGHRHRCRCSVANVASTANNCAPSAPRLDVVRTNENKSAVRRPIICTLIIIICTRYIQSQSTASTWSTAPPGRCC